MDNFHYFILFDTYEDAMAMHYSLDEASIDNKISPAPLDLVEGVSCGVAIMLLPDDKIKLDKFLENNKLNYLRVIKAERTLKPHRDRYC